MPSRVRLTEKIVKSAAPRADDWQLFDEDVRGFALVVYPSGTRAFTLSYRVAGRPRRIVIGRWPDWSVVAARERAKVLRREVDAGADPLAARQEARSAPRVAELVDRYVREHLPRLAPRNASDQESMLRQLVLPHWRTRLVEEISPADVERVLSAIAEDPENPRPVRANRCGEVLRKMFALAVGWKMRPDNPAAGFRKRPELERERFLSIGEIERLAAALGRASNHRGAGIIRLCLLTGARLGEVRQARFDQFNLDLLIWTKQAATTKQRRIHRLPISPEAAAVIRQRRAAVPEGCPWLFPGDKLDAHGAPLGPVQDVKRFWSGVCAEAELADLRIHDLRHTFASLLVSGGSSLEMIGKLLGHTSAKTTQRYAHLMDSPLRAGVAAVADLVRPRPRVVKD